MRYYVRNDSGCIEVRSGEWHVEDGHAYRVDEYGIDYSYGYKYEGTTQLLGWPDADVDDYGRVLIPRSAD